MSLWFRKSWFDKIRLRHGTIGLRNQEYKKRVWVTPYRFGGDVPFLIWIHITYPSNRTINSRSNDFHISPPSPPARATLRSTWSSFPPSYKSPRVTSTSPLFIRGLLLRSVSQYFISSVPQHSNPYCPHQGPRTMRAIPRPFAARTAFAPIETIVFVFVLATLSYFYILSAIRQSTYFALSAPNNLRPAYALLTDNEWVPVSGKDWFKAGVQLELQPVVFSFDNVEVGCLVSW